MLPPNRRPTPKVYDGPLRWTIPSGSRPGDHHLIELDAYQGNGRCSCPDFTCRHEPDLRREPQLGGVDRTRCKHIRLVRDHFLDQIIREIAKGAIALAIILAPLSAAPSEAFLDALAWTETRNNPQAVGDAGEARSAFQWHRSAWIETTHHRKLQGLPVASYEAGTACPGTSREYARTLLGLYEARLRKLGLDPEPHRLWLSWTMGWTGARQIGFRPGLAPSHKRRGLARLLEKLGDQPATVP